MDTKTEIFKFSGVRCPVCGRNKFIKGSVPKAEPKGTIFYCYTGRDNITWDSSFCPGIACYCNKCKKHYPSTNFGFHSGAYECKTCGAVQWEYTDYVKVNEEFSQILNRVRMNF